jgi:DNA ligase-1
MDIAGWYMSEKLDGVRAYWNGDQLLSRQGHAFNAPAWFTKAFPPFALDGELWSGRGEFEKIQSITSQDAPHQGWRQITYHVFEVPHASGALAERLQRITAYLSRHQGTKIRVVPQERCRDGEHLQTYLEQVVAQGGEGLVLRNPSAPYESGRVANALKVKTFDDMEGEVVGYRPGKGKYAGVVGALQIELESGQRFFVGSGLSDSDREDPPPLGALVTFRHHGFTKNGIPRFASFLRVREVPGRPKMSDDPRAAVAPRRQ